MKVRASKPKRKLPYVEGDWFAVPLDDDQGYALGLIARAKHGGKILFGYFFGPTRQEVPTLAEIRYYTPGDAIFMAVFGDLGLCEGKWPVIGHEGHHDRSNWPMPSFVRTDVISGESSLIRYSEDDLTTELEHRCVVDADRPGTLPEDGLFGYRAVEIRLTRLLS